MLNPQHIAALLDEAPVALLDPALAYIGPGAGLGAIAITIALALGVLLLVIGLVWYPLKRVLNGRKAEAVGASQADEVE